MNAYEDDFSTQISSKISSVSRLRKNATCATIKAVEDCALSISSSEFKADLDGAI